MKIKSFIAACLLMLPLGAFADEPISTNQINSVSTGVPFLTIAPDSRASGMGDVGVATSPDINSMYWNPAKYGFIGSDAGVALSYSPWLRKLVDDMSLAYLAGFKRLDQRQVVAASLRYFDLGSITFTDINGEPLREGNPSEFYIDLGYSLLLSDHVSGGIAFRYIHSDMASGINGSKAANTFAADISMYYESEVRLGYDYSTLSFGANISNIGAKIKYSNSENKEFIPTNLRLGASLLTPLDSYNSLRVSLDLNKLLVPTPPIKDADGNIVKGKDNDVSVIQGIFQSFGDAPDGFSEELKEIQYGLGLEYWYNNQFAVRTGYHHESDMKGNRRYFTVGAGAQMNVFGIDISYLIPVDSNNSLANTMRFSLLFNIDRMQRGRRR